MAWLGSQVKITSVPDGTSNTFLYLELSNYAVHARMDGGYGYDTQNSPPTPCPANGSNPFFFVEEAGQGIIVASTGGTVATVIPPNTELSDDRGSVSNHPNPGVNVSMVDGSVHWVSNGVSMTVWFSCFTRDGGEPPPDW